MLNECEVVLFVENIVSQYIGLNKTTVFVYFVIKAIGKYYTIN